MNDEEQDELAPAEDWPTFFTQVPVWLTLSDIPDRSLRIYTFLAEHLNNGEPGRRTACPKQAAIARAIHLKKAQQVKAYTDALVRIGALEIQEYRYQNGMRRGKRYILRFNPPPGFTGPRSLKDFYELNPDVKSAAAPGRTAEGIGAVQSGSGRPARNKTAGHAGTPKSGSSHAPKSGSSHAPKSGSPEVDQEKQDQLKTPAAADLVPHQRASEAVENPAAAVDDDTMREAHRVLALLPSTWRQSRAQALQVAPHIAERLRRGWMAQDLVHTITDNPKGLKSPAAAVLRRVKDLALDPPRKPRTEPVRALPEAPPADPKTKTANALSARAELRAKHGAHPSRHAATAPSATLIAEKPVTTCFFCQDTERPGWYINADLELVPCDHEADDD